MDYIKARKIIDGIVSSDMMKKKIKEQCEQDLELFMKLLKDSNSEKYIFDELDIYDACTSYMFETDFKLEIEHYDLYCQILSAIILHRTHVLKKDVYIIDKKSSGIDTTTDLLDKLKSVKIPEQLGYKKEGLIVPIKDYKFAPTGSTVIYINYNCTRDELDNLTEDHHNIVLYYKQPPTPIMFNPVDVLNIFRQVCDMLKGNKDTNN